MKNLEWRIAFNCNKLLPKSHLSQMFSQSFLSLVGKAGVLASNTVVLLLLARWRGPIQAGSYSLAIKYAALFLSFALQGTDSLLIRDVAQNPLEVKNYLSRLSIVRFFMSILACTSLAVFVLLVPNYDSGTTKAIILFSLTIIPEGLSRLFQSALMTLGTYSPFAISGGLSAILGLVSVVLALSFGAHIELIIFLQLAIKVLSLVPLAVPLIQKGYLSKAICSIRSVFPSIKELLRWQQRTFPFAVIDILFTLEWQIDIILLSFYTDEKQVGIYGVAQSLLSLLMLILYSVDTDVYPRLSRAVVEADIQVKQLYTQILFFLFITVIPAAGILALFFSWIIPIIFGPEFVAAVVPAYWLIAAWAIHFLTVPSARLIVSLGYQNLLALSLAISFVIGTLLGIVLIPRMGIRAAAMARFTSALIYATLCAAEILYLRFYCNKF
jgi:O-antigen/teichoic acid export membrane protein